MSSVKENVYFSGNERHYPWKKTKWKEGTFMDRKKYRICIIFLLVCIVAGTAALYFWKGRKESAPKDGVLVQEMEDFVEDEVTA